jgi:predicted O-methyltransferase YrrM
MATILQMRGSQNMVTGLQKLCYGTKSLLNNREDLNIVEIGCYCGHSTLIINSCFQNATINCVDPWKMYREEGSTYDLDNQAEELKQAEQIFDQNIKPFPNIKKNKMFSIQFADSVDNDSLDLVYIDGDHSYSAVKQDIIAWMPKVKVGGVISGHDFSWETVRKALAEVFARNPNGVFEDDSWAYIKTQEMKDYFGG